MKSIFIASFKTVPAPAFYKNPNYTFSTRKKQDSQSINHEINKMTQVVLFGWSYRPVVDS
jgi:hypothetical protein